VVGHLPGCSRCGAGVEPVDLDILTALPDPVRDLPADRRAAASGNRDFQMLDGVGAFIRCLMPVRLSGGGQLTYSVWLSVDDDQLRAAYADWETPAYRDLVLDGTIANAIRPWPDLSGESARAEVRETDVLPYLVGEPGSLLEEVLTVEWDRDDVLSRIRDPLPVPVRQQITAEWSIERTAGLGSRLVDVAMRFTGPGRTVHLEAFDMPSATTVEDAVAAMLDGAPAGLAGELSERDGELVRHAFWLETEVDGQTEHDFSGVVARGTAVLSVTCVYDEAEDLDWALATWRSACHH
jgi:hypothetical protein